MAPYRLYKSRSPERGNEMSKPMLNPVAARATVAVAFAALGFPTSAHAQANWVGFGQDQPIVQRPAIDQNFVKEWEASPPKGFPTLSKQNLAAMAAAIKRYEDVVARGGFPAVAEQQMSIGLFGRDVALLKERLALSGDMRDADSDVSQNFDYGLEKAVKRFQASNGLSPTGVVDKRTIAALNVPAAVRLRQLKVNLQRLTELARSAPKKYVVVNIPAAQIEAVDGDQVVSRHAGVVGKTDRQTPILRSSIHQLNFNPVWHLPPTVLSQDLVPKGAAMAAKGEDVLAKYGIDALDASGRKVDTSKIKWNAATPTAYTFQQKPGPENPLGFVKINFDNSHSVYMHSTPSDTLFGRNFRAASSGCVRVSGIDQLAAWLLADQGGWSQERVLGMKKSGERLDVSLKKPVPLYFAYVTAWATEDGVIQFRRDLYNKDSVGQVAGAY
jgi:L,D-transpeptidase YcbB